jgi:hypothetical protein
MSRKILQTRSHIVRFIAVPIFSTDNVFSLGKRIKAYKTPGSLFKELKEQIIEYTITERIWRFIQELLCI